MEGGRKKQANTEMKKKEENETQNPFWKYSVQILNQRLTDMHLLLTYNGLHRQRCSFRKSDYPVRCVLSNMLALVNEHHSSYQ